MRSHEITERTTRDRTSPETKESVCEGAKCCGCQVSFAENGK
jgi:hypothetical protein